MRPKTIKQLVMEMLNKKEWLTEQEIRKKTIKVNVNIGIMKLFKEGKIVRKKVKSNHSSRLIYTYKIK